MADAFRLRLPKSDLGRPHRSLPPGPGPLLLLAPNSGHNRCWTGRLSLCVLLRCIPLEICLICG